jgi:hypothetical protein
MGWLWWGFNSFVVIAGGVSAMTMGAWWGVFGIAFGLLGIPIIVRKFREGNYL